MITCQMQQKVNFFWRRRSRIIDLHKLSYFWKGSNLNVAHCEATSFTKMPLHTLLAHDGRVNAIVYSPATKIIYTAGNDGFLCAFRASLRDGLELVSKRNIQKELQGKLSRITVVSILRECENVCHLALGSSEGQLCFVTTKINEESVDICIDTGLFL